MAPQDIVACGTLIDVADGENLTLATGHAAHRTVAEDRDDEAQESGGTSNAPANCPLGRSIVMLVIFVT
jgi:hypothetical protein